MARFVSDMRGCGDSDKMAALVAEDVDAQVLPSCDHFVPEERPDEVTRRILELTGRTDT